MADNTVSEVVVTAPTKRSPIRRPRHRVLINGEAFEPEGGEWTRNRHFEADTFRLNFYAFDNGADLDFWLNTTPIEVEIQSGDLQDDGSITWATRLIGIVDDVDMGLTGSRVCLSGRDRTALFEETKTKQTYPNLTASEIVQKLAAEHGMQADVQATTTKVGAYYKADHTHIAPTGDGKTQKQWDMMIFLARKEGFDLWVDGNTVHFKDADEDTDVVYIYYSAPKHGDGYAQDADSSVIDLRASRSLNASKDIKVVVRSFHPLMGKRHTAVTQTKKKSQTPGHNYTAGSGKESEGVTVYYFDRPKMTPDQAQEEANRLYGELTDREYTIEFEAPADMRFAPPVKVNIVGDGLGVLDQDYFIDSVTIHFGSREGEIMEVTAKNHPEPGEEGSE